MAIDTKEKRANVIGVGRPFLRTKEPSADKDQQWRVATGLGYGGNAIGLVIRGLDYTLPANRLHYTLPPNRLHGTLPAGRLHYTLPDED